MMEDNNKLFVFEKKEVVLIFVFTVVIAITTFTLGVRIGKQLSLKEDGYTREDVEKVELRSIEEEYVDQATGEAPRDFEQALRGSEGAVAGVDPIDDVEARLREEMEKLAAGDLAAGENEREESSPQIEGISGTDDLYAPPQDMAGKFTIQLYANQSKAAAQDFADAFIVKGYDVIINEAAIPGKGTWYRVSVGLFDSLEQARTYLREEQDLFRGEDYIIQQL